MDDSGHPHTALIRAAFSAAEGRGDTASRAVVRREYNESIIVQIELLKCCHDLTHGVVEFFDRIAENAVGALVLKRLTGLERHVDHDMR